MQYILVGTCLCMKIAFLLQTFLMFLRFRFICLHAYSMNVLIQTMYFIKFSCITLRLLELVPYSIAHACYAMKFVQVQITSEQIYIFVRINLFHLAGTVDIFKFVSD